MVSTSREFILFVHFCLSLISFILFIMLSYKYAKDENKKSSAHHITRMLIVLTFFMFIDGIYYFLIEASQYRLIPMEIYVALSNPKIELFARFGIFISVIWIVHFVMQRRIELFKHHENSLQKLESLNHELEKKVKEMEFSQDSLQSKLHELERFNKIAHSRESKMLDLIKKIEFLEEKLKNKGQL